MVSTGAAAPWTMTGRQSVLGAAFAALGRWSRRGGRRIGDVLQVALRLLLMVAGFGAITAAAWVGIGLWAGLLVGGVALLLLEWAVKR